MSNKAVRALLRNGTGLDSLDAFTDTARSVLGFRKAFAEEVAEAESGEVPQLLGDWDFVLRLNDAALFPVEKYLDLVSTGPATALSAISSMLTDGLAAGCRRPYFGRVVRLLLFEVFSETASPAATKVLEGLFCFEGYYSTGKGGEEGNTEAIRAATRIGNGLFPAKDKVDLSEPLSSFPAWAMTGFASSESFDQAGLQDLVAMSEGKNTLSLFLAGTRELYSDNTLLAALGHFLLLRERSAKVNARSVGCLAHFLGVTRNKRAEVLGLLRKRLEDPNTSEESASFALLLARLCGTKQHYGQWLLSVVSEAKRPERVVDSLTNLISIDSPGWITTHINTLQKATKAAENCNEYIRCGRMRLENADEASGISQKKQEQQDPKTFIDDALREFFLTGRLPQSIRSAAFFNASWFNVRQTNKQINNNNIHRKQSFLCF